MPEEHLQSPDRGSFQILAMGYASSAEDSNSRFDLLNCVNRASHNFRSAFDTGIPLPISSGWLHGDIVRLHCGCCSGRSYVVGADDSGQVERLACRDGGFDIGSFSLRSEWFMSEPLAPAALSDAAVTCPVNPP